MPKGNTSTAPARRQYVNDSPIAPREFGKVRVVTSFDLDEYGYEYVCDTGRFVSYFTHDNDNAPIYYRLADIVRLPGSDIWRDRKGRIAKAPEYGQYAHSRTMQFIQVNDWYDETLRQAFAAADRVESYESQHWYYGTVNAVAYVNGREIGRASLSGIESDSGSYIRSTSREVAREALADARVWLNSLDAKAAS